MNRLKPTDVPEALIQEVATLLEIDEVAATNIALLVLNDEEEPARDPEQAARDVIGVAVLLGLLAGNADALTKN